MKNSSYTKAKHGQKRTKLDQWLPGALTKKKKKKHKQGWVEGLCEFGRSFPCPSLTLNEWWLRLGVKPTIMLTTHTRNLQFI